MKNKGVSFVEVLIVIAIVGIIVAAIFGSIQFNNDIQDGLYNDTFVGALQREGYTNVQILGAGTSFWCGDEDDNAYVARFSANSPEGNPVQRELCYEFDDGEYSIR